MKKLDPEKSIYELTEEYPELIGILKDIGFPGIKNPLVRKTVGKRMTLSGGCLRQGKNLDEVFEILSKSGFKIVSSINITDA
ncbi:MAG: DUF1858 domain-containing protein [Spirochaetes bacterium]|nr:DUF1858 domain-containing protein [Spirochaetota bacterium]